MKILRINIKRRAFSLGLSPLLLPYSSFSRVSEIQKAGRSNSYLIWNRNFSLFILPVPQDSQKNNSHCSQRHHSFLNSKKRCHSEQDRQKMPSTGREGNKELRWKLSCVLPIIIQQWWTCKISRKIKVGRLLLVRALRAFLKIHKVYILFNTSIWTEAGNWTS